MSDLWNDLTDIFDSSYGDWVLFFLVMVIGILVGKFLSLLFTRLVVKKGGYESLAPVSKVIYYLFVLAALFIGLSFFAINLTGVLVMGGFIGIAIGFAAQSVISNLLSGMFLRIERPFKIGDAVDISGTGGIVEQITIFSTIIRTWDGLIVRIPNETVFTTNLTNIWGCTARRVQALVSISYTDDQDRAIMLLKERLAQHPLVLVEPAPQVFVSNLGDNGVDITLRAWVPTTEWINLYMEIHNLAKHTVEEDGMCIPFPQRVHWDGKEAYGLDQKDDNPALSDGPIP